MRWPLALCCSPLTHLSWTQQSSGSLVLWRTWADWDLAGGCFTEDVDMEDVEDMDMEDVEDMVMEDMDVECG